MSTQIAAPSAAANQAAAGKYLTFLLGRESYGIPVLGIREIIRLTDVTPVPQMPPYVKGVLNLRGKIIPVVDLRIKFCLANTDTTERTCIVVVQVNLPSGARNLMGLIVDDVEEVVNIAQGDIEETPDFGMQIDTDYILGMAKIKGVVKPLLDIDRVVTGEALQAMTQSLAAG
jgi:purine-binding chemotaxis protein CheW